MKKRIIFPVVFLFLAASFFPYGNITKAAFAKTYPKTDLVQLTVAKGDCLINICKKYLDTENRWKEIARINHLLTPHMLQPGAKIMVPVTYLKGMPQAGKVTFVQGEARSQARGRGAWVTLNIGDLISPKSRLKTGNESALEVTYEDGSTFFLRPDTEVSVLKSGKISESNIFRELYLDTGRVISKVRKATGEASRYKVYTPSAVAAVRGTEFRITVDKKQKTFAEVMENRITVDAANKSVDLAQGEGTMVKKGKAPLPARKLLSPPGPVNLQSIYNTEPVIAFTRINNVLKYRVMVASDQEGKHLLRDKIINPGDNFKITGLADGSYYLLLSSIDQIGLEGLASAAYPLKIRSNPLPPMTSNPREKAEIKGKTVAFEWLSISNVVRYHIQVSEDREFSRIVLNKDDVTNSSFKANMLEYKPYYFRISSIAEDGYQGAWSDPLSFTVIPLPPTPTVEQPVISKDEINLRSRSVGDGFTYHFQIAKDEQFKDILIDQKVDKPELMAKKPQAAGKYFVRTAAVDCEGNAGEFSTAQNFEIEEEFPYGWVGGSMGLMIILLLIAH